jgi:hypothetical protein
MTNDVVLIATGSDGRWFLEYFSQTGEYRLRTAASGWMGSFPYADGAFNYARMEYGVTDWRKLNGTGASE